MPEKLNGKSYSIGLYMGINPPIGEFYSQTPAKPLKEILGDFCTLFLTVELLPFGFYRITIKKVMIPSAPDMKTETETINGKDGESLLLKSGQTIYISRGTPQDFAIEIFS
jgi:hypothetical protein